MPPTFSLPKYGRWIALAALAILVIVAISALIPSGPPQPGDTTGTSASVADGGAAAAGRDAAATALTTPAPTSAGGGGGRKKPWIVDAQGGAGADARDLPTVLARAADGDTILLKPGIYIGSIVLSRPVRLVGDTSTGSGPQVFLKASGAEAVAIRTPGVVIESIGIHLDTPGAGAAVSIAANAGLEMVNSQVQSMSSLGIVASGSAALKVSKSAFWNTAGTAVQLENAARAEITDSTFAGNQRALAVLGEAQATLRACTFQTNGMRNGRGAVLSVAGEKAQVTAEGCVFSGNPAGLEVTERAYLAVTNSHFKDNGIWGEPGGWSQGLIAVKNEARATLTGGTFESNRQGIAIFYTGTVEIEGCRFTGNGLQTDNKGLLFVSHAISAGGANARMIVRKTGVAQSRLHGLNITDGAHLTLEDSDISRNGQTGLVAGVSTGPPTRVEVKRTRFDANQYGGCIIAAGSSAVIEDSEVRGSRFGVLAQDKGTQVQLLRVAAIGNRDQGVCAASYAELTAMECSFTDNGCGAQSGWPGKSQFRGELAVEHCRFENNRTFDLAAYSRSHLTATDCTYAPDEKAKLHRDRSAVLKQHPPPSSSSSARRTAAQTEEIPGTERDPETEIAPDDGTENTPGSGSASTPRRQSQSVQRERERERAPSTPRRTSTERSRSREVVDEFRRLRRYFP